MSARAWIIIMTMGLVGLCLLGLLTKFAVDSTPDLQRMIQFKSALASEFEDRGVEEVSMRKLHAKGYHVLLTVGPGETSPGDRLETDVARYFVEKFPDRTVIALEVEKAARPSFGCGTIEPGPKRQFTLGQVRAEMAEEERRRRLEAEVAAAMGFRVVECGRQAGTLRVVAEAPPGYAGDLTEAARKIEPFVRSTHGGKYSSLEVRARGPAAPSSGGAGLDGGAKDRGGAPASAPPREAEVRFDRAGKETTGLPAGRPGKPAVQPGAGVPTGQPGAPATQPGARVPTGQP
jgi:hypothetical protein